VSIALNQKVLALERDLAEAKALIAALKAAVDEVQALLREVTRASTKTKAA